MHSLYLHIPFCKQRCHYCDFHFSTTFKYKKAMVEALCEELFLRKNEADNSVLKTIYFGGGTPSVLETKELQQILETISHYYHIAPEAEITIEINPDDFGGDKHSVKELKELGFNRLSIGVQSFFDEDLHFMNRSHNAEQAQEIIKQAQIHFENFSIDLIYGLPDMSEKRWIENIEKALSFSIPHLSAYALTVEPHTALYHFVKNKKIIPSTDENMQKQFFTLKNLLEKKGYEHYELSNFAKEGYFSKNNTAYWEQKKYMGIGPSAHSFDGERRWWNVANNIQYIKNIQGGKLPATSEILSLENKYNELIMTGLRTKKGISLQQIELLSASFLPYLLKESEKYLQNGMLSLESEYLKITPKGIYLSDGIASDLFWA